LRCQIPQANAGDLVWCANLNAYFTHAISSSPQNGWIVGIQPVQDNGWNAATLNWSNAPIVDMANDTTMDPANAGAGASILYDSTQPSRYWARWPLSWLVVLANAVTSPPPICLALASPTETTDLNQNTPSWVYFSHSVSGNLSGPDPVLLYAVGGQAPFPLQILWPVRYSDGQQPWTETPEAYLAGQPVTCKVTVYPPATVDLRVTLSSSNASVAPVPATLVIPNGSAFATFTIEGTPDTQNTAVTINAICPQIGVGGIGQSAPAASLVDLAPLQILWPGMQAGAQQQGQCQPQPITGGQSITGTIVLAQAAATDTVVTFTSSSANVPTATATVTAGSTTAAFTITTTAVTEEIPVTITPSCAQLPLTDANGFNPTVMTFDLSPAS
jgi:hypothetical protein